MRLINVGTLQLEDFTLKQKPPYAILSHTWGNDEISFQDISSGRPLSGDGYTKILMTCQLAKQHGLRYTWVDTCCIDNANSSELSEAINSMFRWYEDSQVCFAYLSDLSGSNEDDVFLCRWWTRGWTLQELIAPRNLAFYDRDWRLVGTRDRWEKAIESRAGCSYFSARQPLSLFSVSERMSWAASRNTTRLEDEAYSLLGVFGINMPLIYGEGRNAFTRLQEEIIKRSDDSSIFACQPDIKAPYRLLAQSARQFRSSWVERDRIGGQIIESTITNKGLVMIDATILLKQLDKTSKRVYIIKVGGIERLPLRKIAGNVFIRHPEVDTDAPLLDPSIRTEKLEKIYIRLDVEDITQFYASRIFLPGLPSFECSPPSIQDGEFDCIVSAFDHAIFPGGPKFALRWVTKGHKFLFLNLGELGDRAQTRLYLLASPYPLEFDDLFDPMTIRLRICPQRLNGRFPGRYCDGELRKNSWNQLASYLNGSLGIYPKLLNQTQYQQDCKLQSGNWHVSFVPKQPLPGSRGDYTLQIDEIPTDLPARSWLDFLRLST